jgi:hypothetical protein
LIPGDNDAVAYNLYAKPAGIFGENDIYKKGISFLIDIFIDTILTERYLTGQTLIRDCERINLLRLSLRNSAYPDK